MAEVTQSRGSPGYEPQSLTGKRVVVTGGTTGIGRATARLLAARGAQVLIFGRHEEELEMLRPEDIAACVYYCPIQPRRCDVVGVEIRPHLQTI